MSKEIEKLLGHTDAEVRRQALKDLGKHEHDLSVVIPFTVKKLEDGDWRVRKTAIEILLEIKGKTVIDALIGALYREDNANARNSAIDALVSLGSEATNQLIEAYKNAGTDVRKFIIDIFGNTGDLKGVPLLLKALEDRNENIRASAVEHLGNIRGNVSVINALTEVLKNEDIWLAYPAANALGRIADARAVDALVSVLPLKALREPVIRSLGQIADVRSLSSIAPFLKDKSKTIREESVRAIGQFFLKGIPGEKIVDGMKGVLGNKARDILLPHTKSNERGLKVAALLLLGLFKDRNAIAPLLEMSIEEDLQEPVIRNLAFIGKATPRSLVRFFSVNDAYQRRVICEVAGRVRADVFFKHLVVRLKDEDGHVRGKAAIALSHLNNPKAVAYIKPLLLDEYENIQEEAVNALSKLKKWLNIDEVIRGLSDKNITLKRNSALLLGLLREQSSIAALGTALRDSNLKVRKAVVEALGAVDGPTALKYLIQALTDESSEVRLIAAIAIGRTCLEEATEPLIILLLDADVRVRAAAAEGLGKIGNKKAIEPLLQLLSDESGFVKAAVIEALGNFKDKKVKNALLQLLNDRDAEIRSAAVESLANFDGVAHDIIQLLKDKEWSVRKKAVDVLGKFFKDESYAYLKELASTDKDFQVREAAVRHLGV